MAPENWSDESNQKWVSVTSLARALGRSVETVRRWERTDLIPPASMREAGSGRRLYTVAAAREIMAIAKKIRGIEPAYDDEMQDENNAIVKTDDKKQWRPTPWAEIESQTNGDAIDFSDLSSTARYEKELDRVDRLIRRPSGDIGSNYCNRNRRSRGPFDWD
jgi:DNA-binding transcriptional MerR regulator